jgi:predicted Rossmann-fold nucleotide-binding protein
MEIMIERSDAFVIFPGGAGTVQEMLALLIFKHQGHPSTLHKPVVVFNRTHADGHGFWTPIIDLVRPWCVNGEFTVVNEFDALLPTVETLVSSCKSKVSTN